MKKALSLFLAFLLTSANALGLLVGDGIAAAQSNLIANPSLETAAGGASAPQGWYSNSWGSNSATFSYLNTGRTGSRSVKVSLSSYASGDAKWFFEPVAVSGGQTYTYSQYYQSNTATDVVAQYTDAAGVNSYLWLGTVPADGGWRQLSYNFTVAANAAKLSVFHVVANVGWLIIDDAALSLYTPPPPPADGNLISNPSLETAAGGASAPQGWYSNSWGSNSATFSYLNTGRTGSRSVKTEVSNFVSGDAKWFFEPVAVSGGQTYTYSQYYKSSVTTQLIAQYTSGTGSVSYQPLGSAPASSLSWQKTSASLSVPGDVVKAAIFQVVAANGWLIIDDASLKLDTSLKTTIPNPSLEKTSPDPKLPASWQKNSWGSNSATFSYLNTGRTGSRSVKVSLSSYASGDAKWFFEPINSLQRGQQYKFSVWYKTNTVPHPVAMFIKDDGSEKYFGMPAPQPSGSTTQWQFYSDTFSVPVDAKAVSVFMYISSNGWVQTDDYDIIPYQPVGFQRPLVSLTFDDGQEDNVLTAIPMLNAYNFKSTYCFATEYIENNAAQRQNVLSIYNGGHEVCSHTVSHPFLTRISSSQRSYELSRSKAVLESITGSPVRNFASPYGDYNAAAISQIKQFYQSHRTVDEGYNSKDNFNAYRLRVQNVQYNTTIDEYQSWLDRAKADRTWLILVYHRVADNPGQFDSYISDFAQQLQRLSASGLSIKTYNDALAEVTAQLP